MPLKQVFKILKVFQETLNKKIAGGADSFVEGCEVGQQTCHFYRLVLLFRGVKEMTVQVFGNLCLPELSVRYPVSPFFMLDGVPEHQDELSIIDFFLFFFKVSDEVLCVVGLVLDHDLRCTT